MSRADRGEQLLATAEQVFAERGYRAASMEEIAERAGVTKPVLYDHFGSKDGLLAAVVARSGAAIRESTQTAIAAADGPADALQRGLRAYFTFIEEHATAWSVVLTEVEATSAASAQLDSVRHGLAEFVAELIAAELPDCDIARARLYAQAVVGATERLALHARTDPALTPDVLTDALMDLAWMGLAAVNAGRRWH
jgi:AcrR family transcriptional regulator